MTIEKVRDIVEEVTELTLNSISRKQEYVHARYIYIMLAIEFTTATYETLAGLVGRDHSSVNHCKLVFDQSVIKDSRYFKWYRDSRDYLTTGYKNIDRSKRGVIDRMRDDLAKIRDEYREPLDPNQERLLSIYNSLPKRLKEDVMFKIEVAHKLNEKQKKDINVIYTEA